MLRLRLCRRFTAASAASLAALSGLGVVREVVMDALESLAAAGYSSIR